MMFWETWNLFQGHALPPNPSEILQASTRSLDCYSIKLVKMTDKLMGNNLMNKTATHRGARPK